MGANKTKMNKVVLGQLVARTNRTPEDIKAMYAIFRRHFPSGKIESPEDLWRCLQKFSLVPIGSADPTVIDRLYRLFDVQNRYPRGEGGIDFFQFMVISNILEHGSAAQKIGLYFESFDVNHDGIITRDDLEACLPPTVESQPIIQQLLRQWDMNRDGVVSKNDFEQFIMTKPELAPMFVDVKERVRMDSVTVASSIDNNQSANYVNVNRGNIFITQ